MKLKKHVIPALFSLLLAASLSGCQNGAQNTAPPTTEAIISETTSDGGTSEETAINQVNPDKAIPDEKENFYLAVNSPQLDSWEIPGDQSSISYPSLCEEQIIDFFDSEISAIAENLDSYEPGSDERNLGAYFLTAMDADARNAYGSGPLGLSYLEEIDGATTVSELLISCAQMDRAYGIGGLFSMVDTPDPLDSSRKIPVLMGPSFFLPREAWTSQDSYGDDMQKLLVDYLKTLLTVQGSSPEAAESLIKELFPVFKDLAISSYSLEQTLDSTLVLRQQKMNELPDICSENIPLEELCRIYGISPETSVILYDPDLWSTLGALFTEEKLPLLKEYTKILFYNKCAKYTDLTSYDAIVTFQSGQNGVMELLPLKERQIIRATSDLPHSASRVYVKNKFPEEARETLQSLVDDILDTFRKRLENLEWMEEETKQNAYKKLDSMTCRIGYPNDWPPYSLALSLKSPEEGGHLFDNMCHIWNAQRDELFKTLKEPVNPEIWTEVYAHNINAFYSSTDNSINLLAGILQPPFFDPNATKEENLGGIGVIIGHELTHAFDVTGSQFDEHGNLEDWWTEGDKAAFEALAEKTISYYNSYSVLGVPVNSAASVGENMADLGGVACVTDLAESEGLNLELVYRQYAVIWCTKIREEALKNNAASDVHAPNEVRVNAVLSAMPEFYELYGVEEGDGMYQAPEKRPQIW